MKKIFLVLSILMCAAGVQAQDYIKEGDALFNAGQYAEAKRKYEGWLLVNNSIPHVATRIGQCDQCMQLLPVADYLFTSGNLDEARAKYSEILAINPNDPVAKARVAQIPDEKGVWINGVKWATRNVDKPGTFAARPEDPGMFYQWNRRKGWPATGDVYDWDNSNAPGDRWSKANDPCPAGWRVPTTKEFELLYEAGYMRLSRSVAEGTLTSHTFGDHSSVNNTIFLPASGYRSSASGLPSSVGSSGIYWSGTAASVTNARNLYFYSGSVAPTNSDNRSAGFSVRCVAE